MPNVKMCVECHRLLNLNVVECYCGNTEFQEVRLNLEEEPDEPIQDALE